MRQAARGAGMLSVCLSPQQLPGLAALLQAGKVRGCARISLQQETQTIFALYSLPGQGIGHSAAEGKAVEANSFFSLLWSYHYFLPQPEFFSL